MQVDIDSHGWPAPGAAWGEWAALAERVVAAALGVAAPGLAALGAAAELAIRLTDDAAVHALNRTWRGKDRPTNVLSFPQLDAGALAALAAAEVPPGAQGGVPEILLGDIVLAHGVCAREAADKGISLADHAAHLIVHGLLHLLGHDHQDDAAAAAMEALEVKILANLGIADPYVADIQPE